MHKINSLQLVFCEETAWRSRLVVLGTTLWYYQCLPSTKGNLFKYIWSVEVILLTLFSTKFNWSLMFPSLCDWQKDGSPMATTTAAFSSCVPFCWLLGCPDMHHYEIFKQKFGYWHYDFLIMLLPEFSDCFRCCSRSGVSTF